METLRARELAARSPAAVPFPVDVFPEAVRRFVREQARRLGCPVDYLGVPLLASVGAALGNAWRLHMPEGGRVTAALWAVVVGPAGSGKSAALRAVLRPHLDAQRQALLEFRRALEQWETFTRTVDLERPVPRRLFVSALRARDLKAQPRGVTVVAEDFAAWLAGKDRERGTLVEAWDAEQLVLELPRTQGYLAVVGCPAVGLLGGLRTEALAALEQLPAAAGVLERCLFAYAETTGGAAGPMPDEEVVRGWAAVVKRLLVEREREASKARVSSWTEKAKAAWLAFEQEPHAGVSDPLRGAWAKLRGYVPRLALALQALYWASGEADGRDVELVSCQGAVRLVGYFEAMARRVYGVVRCDPRIEGGKRVLAWLEARPGTAVFRRRDVYRTLCRQFARPEDLDGPLALLAELGYLKAVEVEEAGRVVTSWEVLARGKVTV